MLTCIIAVFGQQGQGTVRKGKVLIAGEATFIPFQRKLHLQFHLLSFHGMCLKHSFIKIYSIIIENEGGKSHNPTSYKIIVTIINVLGFFALHIKTNTEYASQHKHFPKQTNKNSTNCNCTRQKEHTECTHISYISILLINIDEKYQIEYWA